MDCCYLVTSRSTLIGSMPTPGKPTIVRRWRSPSRAACARLSHTAIADWGSSTSVRAGSGRRRRISKPQRRCTATWAWDSGWKRTWQSVVKKGFPDREQTIDVDTSSLACRSGSRSFVCRVRRCATGVRRVRTGSPFVSLLDFPRAATPT